MPETSGSEVARLRQRLQEEYEAAQRGLNGLASGTARHAFINARMQHIASLHEELIEQVGPDEAIALVANSIWGATEQTQTP